MDNLFYNKIRKYGFWLLILVLIAIQIHLGLNVGYPPSKEQLMIRTDSLLAIRLAAIGLISIGVFVIYRTIRTITGSPYTGKVFIIMLVSSPVLMGLWLTRPFESAKFVVVMIGIYLIFNSRKMFIWMALMAILIIAFNYFQNFDKANIYSFFNNKELIRQTEEKFLREDDLVERIKLPIWFRRIGYNKLSMFIRDVSKESISFWNLEDYFYQEFPPNSKKSLVIFFWPLIIPFIVGLYSVGNSRNSKLIMLLAAMLFLAFLNYLFSSSTENYRLILSVPLVAIIIALGVEKLKNIKWIYFLIMVFWIYGWQLFNYDFNKRPDFWLDNRPLVYKFIFKKLEGLDKDQRIVVTDIAGDARKYCKYYLKDKCTTNIDFRSFNLKNERTEDGSIYAGFEGEFLGADLNNKFPENSEKIIISKGYEKIGTLKIRDSIAYKYGELLFVGYKK